MKRLHHDQVQTTCDIETVKSMKRKEVMSYAYVNFLKQVPNYFKLSGDEINIRESPAWRGKICNWTYNVIDHFDLSRETAAISINLFDRFLATKGNICDGSFALLASLTTLYIAIKTNEKKKIRLTTLCQLSRDQFNPQEIETMELEILHALSWLIHPPTVVAFIYCLIEFLPSQVSPSVRQDIFEMSRYLAELSVCDPFFIQFHASTVAFGAVLNVLEDKISYELVPATCRDRFLLDLYRHFNFHRGTTPVRLSRDRLRSMLASTSFDYQSPKASNIDHSMESRYEDDQKAVYSSNDSVVSMASKKTHVRHNSGDSIWSVSSTGSCISMGRSAMVSPFTSGRVRT